jgi:hypothetical protein
MFHVCLDYVPLIAIRNVKTQFRKTIDGLSVPTDNNIDDIPKNPSSLGTRLISWIIS